MPAPYLALDKMFIVARLTVIILIVVTRFLNGRI